MGVKKAEKDDASSDARNGAIEAGSGTAKVSAARLSRGPCALRFDLGSITVPACARLPLGLCLANDYLTLPVPRGCLSLELRARPESARIPRLACTCPKFSPSTASRVCSRRVEFPRRLQTALPQFRSGPIWISLESSRCARSRWQ